MCYALNGREQLEATQTPLEIFGRKEELAALRAFIEIESATPQALVLEGGPGIGKTTLWEAGVQMARERGLRVLSARPSEPEINLSFAALADLLAEIDLDDLDGVPAPQQQALEVALVRANPGEVTPAPFAVSAGFTSVLRALSRREPVLVAVDDVPWLDRSSSDVLAFAARRIRGRAVVYLFARRPGDRPRLEEVLEPSLRRLEVAGLSLGATRVLLFERLGLTLPRRVLRRVFDLADGNPLFALELGRVVVERGTPEIGGELPLPERLDDAFGERVDELAGPVRRALCAVALGGDLSRSELAALVEPHAIEDGVDSGLLLVDRDRVRASHPLLAESAKRHAGSREKRSLHLDLAGVVRDETVRARHLALGTTTPDSELAGEIARASETAIARGAAHDAVELAEHALLLTPLDAPERPARLLALAQYVVISGEERRGAELLEQRIDEFPPGRSRARAHLFLLEAAWPRDADYHVERAIAESEGDATVRTSALGRRATLRMVTQVKGIREAEAWAEDTWARAGAQADPRVVYALAWARVLRGRNVDDLRASYSSSAPSASLHNESIERIAAIRLLFRGDVDAARPMLESLFAHAEEQGEVRLQAAALFRLCELELRAGDTLAVTHLLEQADDWLEGLGGVDVGTEGPVAHARSEALLSAVRGASAEVERWVEETLRLSEREWIHHRLEALRARAVTALLEANWASAAESARAVWEHTLREGIDEPGAFPVAADLVEALLELDGLEEAKSVMERLDRLSEEQEHPWGRTSMRRCQALLAFAVAGYDEDAAAMLAEAAAGYGTLGLSFDRARSLLLLGRAQRRARKWAAARSTLEQTERAFDELGAMGWAEEARSQLARIGGRRGHAGSDLTPTEEQVARLAADGLSNKEIAQRLVVTVDTIEAHLKHAYAKLGIHSRTQLAVRLSARS